MRKISAAIMLVSIMAFAFATHSTNRTITGTVTDESGNPVSGATVNGKGTNIATATASDGKFSITFSSNVSMLVITAVGYETKEFTLGKESNISIILKNSSSELQDVVVTSVGVTKQKKSLSYSTTVVGGSAAPQPVVSNIQQTLNGKVAGLNITSSNGAIVYATPYGSYDKDEEDDNKVPLNRYNNNFNTEGYDNITENPFLKTNDNPLSTFSIDVDAASYSNVRRFINDGSLPPAGAVRIEELINYFSYQYPQPTGDAPFSINTEMAPCPWNEKHKLVLIGLQGKIIPTENLPASNLVFLIDVSGSMDEEDKLPLVKSSLKLLVDQLRPTDRVSLVVYAGNAGVVLPSTSADNKIKIKDAIGRLEAGGSTAGGEGIKLAYNIAISNFVKGGNNRVILCTDGDFNVGISSDDALENLIEDERKSGVFLSVLGFGTGNYQDAKMQKLADKGNGNHQYIDNIGEARKVFVNEFGGTLFTIAKDVKLQIEFNPAKVQGYRLIGYENRMLAKEDFNDDTKDAGELGSGHTVTALYELIPAGVKDDMLKSVDSLRYNTTLPDIKQNYAGNELMYIKLRYKQPDGDVSKLIEHPLTDENVSIKNTSDNFRFAASVAAFGMLLRNSQYIGNGDFETVLNLARNSMGTDAEGYRHEFFQLVKNAETIKGKDEAATR